MTRSKKKVTDGPVTHLLKILIIGDSSVGKSCLMMKFADGSFSESFVSTIGVDFKTRQMCVDGNNAKLQIWDTAGQERRANLTGSYFRGADGALIVYDVRDPDSFRHISRWLRKIEEFEPTMFRAIVANKTDTAGNERKVSREEGLAYAVHLGIPYYETSAKTGQGVEELFEIVTRETLRRRFQESPPQDRRNPPETLDLTGDDFRIPLPIEVDVHERGQVAAVMEGTKEALRRGLKVGIKKQETFEEKMLMGRPRKGEYTKKIYSLRGTLPLFMRLLVTEEQVQMVEESWNAYPRALTEVTNPGFMKEDFFLSLESIHLPYTGGEYEHNACGLEPERLKFRKVEVVDIANDDLVREYNKERDPKVVPVSGETLSPNWIQQRKAKMCCYKVLTIYFQWGRYTAEDFKLTIMENYTDIFARAHRLLYVTYGDWKDFTMEDLRKKEKEFSKKLTIPK